MPRRKDQLMRNRMYCREVGAKQMRIGCTIGVGAPWVVRTLAHTRPKQQAAQRSSAIRDQTRTDDMCIARIFHFASVRCVLECQPFACSIELRFERRSCKSDYILARATSAAMGLVRIWWMWTRVASTTAVRVQAPTLALQNQLSALRWLCNDDGAW